MKNIFFVGWLILSLQAPLLAQSSWYLQESPSMQHLGYAMFNDLILKTKKHEFYIGIGVHFNDSRTDMTGHNTSTDGHGFAFTPIQALEYKIGYRKFLGKEGRAQFFPYSELVVAHMGKYSVFYLPRQLPDRTKEYQFMSIDMTPTTYLMGNVGLGCLLPLNKRLALVAQGGIPMTFMVKNGQIGYISLVSPIIWQVGLKIKLK